LLPANTLRASSDPSEDGPSPGVGFSAAARLMVGGKLQVPALGTGRMKAADFGKMAVEFVKQRLGFVEREFQAVALGEQ